LRLPPRRDQQWGLALVRSIPRNSEASYWPAITRRVEGLAQQFATVEGIAGISPGRNVRLVPYATAAVADLRDPGGQLATSRDGRAGLDAKLIVRDAM